MSEKTWGASLIKRVSVWMAGAAALIFLMATTATTATAAGTADAPTVKAKGRSSVATTAPRRKVRTVAARPSLGQKQGLRKTEDELRLKSSAALVVDQDTNEVLYSKNAEAVLPIASITKLMTAVVVLDAGQSMDEPITVSKVALDTPKNNRSRLRVGATLSRGELMHLALMSSENRAAFSVGAAYPGGLSSLVEAMNSKAHELGMNDSHFVEPTGLSSDNRSSAHDLALLVNAAYQHPLLREYSTASDASVAIGPRMVQFHTTNSLVRNPSWEIGLQKTGYISEAGRCLVMQAELAGRKLIMVLLDSTGRYSRVADAERIRRWLDSMPTAQHAPATPSALAEEPSATVPESERDLGRSGSDTF